MALKPSQLKELLRRTIKAGYAILVKGAPGIGKTEITNEVTEEIGYELVTEIASMSDATDYKGLPDVSGKIAVFKLFENLDRIVNASKPTLWFFDDVGQTTEAVQNTIMHCFQKREISGRRIPDCVTLMAASNDRGQKAGVRGMTTAMKSRFHSIVELVPDLQESCQWFLTHGMSASLLAYLRTVPDALCEFEATQDLTNFPCPRTWFKLSQLEALNLPADVEADTFAGAVGTARAQGYLTFRKMISTAINLDEILLNPDKAAIPSRPDALYAISAGLARRATLTNFASIAVYVNRLIDTNKYGEFGVLTIKDAVRLDGKLARTDTFTKLQSGKAGKLFSGQA